MGCEMKDSTRYIYSVGSLNRKDNSLAFRTDEGLTHLPIEGIKELYLMNEVSINTKLLHFLSKEGVTVHFFGYYENYVGSFYPKEKYVSGKLRVKQSLAYIEGRMAVAKAIVRGIETNMVQFCKKRHVPFDVYGELLVGDATLDACTDIKRLLAIEGQLWQAFYRIVGGMIGEAFQAEKRVKRPPDNPLNALISFGNSWLYSKVISQLYHTHLDQSISYLHEPSESRFSLSLDLAEVFKLVVVFPVIVTMINKGMLRVEDHFDQSMNYCLLNDEGRKKFTLELEKRIGSTFQHKKLKRAVTFETALRLEGYKLTKHLVEGQAFVAFDEKEGV